MIALLAVALQVARVRDSLAPRRLDDFEQVTAWSAHPADGVRMSLHRAPGRRGNALRLDFAFASGGYAVARRALPLDLPPNYAFSIWIRGTAPPNTLEFKLVDASGDNVWWYTERDRRFDGTWHQLIIRKRQIAFAWGPLGGGELQHAASLELVITAGRGGGSGSVWFDDLIITPLPDLGAYHGTPTVTASTSLWGFAPDRAIDGNAGTAWRASSRRPARLTLDFGRTREFGGITLDWEPGRGARDYDVLVSDDGRVWRTERLVRGGDGGRDPLFLPDRESRFVRLVLRAAQDDSGFGLRELTVEPLAFGASRNAFFEAVARHATPGNYPRYFLGERAYWTVVGASGAPVKGLINEDGAVDGGSGVFSIEAFLRDDSLITWRTAAHRVWLEDADLPIPVTEWNTGALRLTITAFATGPAARSSLVVRYRVHNVGAQARRPTLFLAVRPFQVNPPWQFLGTPGGVATIDSLRWTGTALLVNGDRRVQPLTRPARVGVTTFDRGDIVERLQTGSLPVATVAHDTTGAASAALEFPLDLALGDSADVAVEVPLIPREHGILPLETSAATTALEAAVQAWHAELGPDRITLPPAGASLAQAMTSSVGWILVNRDGAAIHPGSRSYARAWIRDGALMSAALLRFGHVAPVREFIDWYAPHQYASGKVPCCVDARGADPVPEHDSNGEFIYLVMEYWRHTGDRALLERMWPFVDRAVAYLDSLRQQRRTPEYREGDQQVFFGLLPPSISHEGYSAKAMHSYWDDLFALRGFKDATTMAEVLGHREDAVRFAAMRDEFRQDLLASLRLVMAQHHISYVPGAADLGDFDPTSTTIALSPVEEDTQFPAGVLDSTFERYWTDLAPRRDGGTWDAYAGYEVRSVGAMLRLGWKTRALSLLQLFLADREPPAWNQWPEVVYRDRRAARFVGDAPHTWVGADFLRSATDLFVYEREPDSTLVIGAGLDSAWLGDSGVQVRGLSTWWGTVSYTARWEGSIARFRIDAGVRVPSGGVVVAAPLERVARATRIDGVATAPDARGHLVVRRVPATVEFEY